VGGRIGRCDAGKISVVPIASVEVFLLDAPLPHRREFSTGGGDSRGASLVRIADDEGTAGWGETYPLPAGVAKLAALGRLLLGRDPDAMAANWALLWGAAAGDGFATSALAIALDDLRARRRRVPVHALYGGARRARARAYASSEGYVPGVANADAWRAEADRAVAAGFTGFKLRIGRDPIPDELQAAAEVRRDHPTLDLMADANAAYTFRQAVHVGRALHDLGFIWFEEPMPTAGYRDYERLRDALPLALAGGESVQSRAEASGLIDRAAVDLIQPDVSICGGIAETLTIGGLARLAAIPTHPHACNGAVNLAASLQVIALLPDPIRLPGDAPLLEHDFGPNVARTDLLRTPLAMRDGCFAIPDGPGLGIDVDEDFVRRTAAETLPAQR
jgi:D-galactarolactone cycloisomerase